MTAWPSARARQSGRRMGAIDKPLRNGSLFLCAACVSYLKGNAGVLTQRALVAHGTHCLLLLRPVFCSDTNSKMQKHVDPILMFNAPLPS